MDAFVYGVCFGALLMIRVNNAILAVGVIFGIFCKLLLEKRWKNLWQNIIAGCAGIGVSVIPFWLCFAQYGVAGEMWNATLLFNILYSQKALHWDWDREGVFLVLQYSVTAFLTAAVSMWHWMKYKDMLSVGCLSGTVCMGLMLAGGRRYKHYFMVYCALIPLLFYLLADVRTRRAVVMVVCSIIPIWLQNPIGKLYVDVQNAKKGIERQDGFHEIYDEVAAFIPAEEREKVAGYNVPAGFWLETGIDSCYKYFVFHDPHCFADERVKREMTDIFRQGRAKWIIVQGEILNTDIRDFIVQNYDVVLEKEGIFLYKKMEEPYDEGEKD